MKIRIVDIEDRILPGSPEFYSMVSDVWGGEKSPVQFSALVHATTLALSIIFLFV
jgi:hypothetical protein